MLNMNKILTAVLILLLGACTFQTRPRGYVFPDDLNQQLARIKTVAQLEEEFGSPQARTIHGPLVFIYYGARENTRGPLPLTWDDRTVLLVWIDGKNVTETRVLRDADLPNVRLARGATPIPAEIELNMFEELINNIGRFTPAGLGQ